MDYVSILTGIGAGVTYGLTTFAKKEGQKFDWLKFGTTIVIGAGAGAGMGLLGMELEVAYTYAIQLGAVPVVENVLKWLYRKVWKKAGGPEVKIKLSNQ